MVTESKKEKSLKGMPRLSGGTWLFWGIMAATGIVIAWGGFVAQTKPMWIGVVIAGVVGFVLAKFGPRPEEEE